MSAVSRKTPATEHGSTSMSDRRSGVGATGSDQIGVSGLGPSGDDLTLWGNAAAVDRVLSLASAGGGPRSNLKAAQSAVARSSVTVATTYKQPIDAFAQSVEKTRTNWKNWQGKSYRSHRERKWGGKAWPKELKAYNKFHIDARLRANEAEAATDLLEHADQQRLVLLQFLDKEGLLKNGRIDTSALGREARSLPGMLSRAGETPSGGRVNFELQRQVPLAFDRVLTAQNKLGSALALIEQKAAEKKASASGRKVAEYDKVKADVAKIIGVMAKVHGTATAGPLTAVSATAKVISGAGSILKLVGKQRIEALRREVERLTKEAKGLGLISRDYEIKAGLGEYVNAATAWRNAMESAELAGENRTNRLDRSGQRADAKLGSGTAAQGGLLHLGKAAEVARWYQAAGYAVDKVAKQHTAFAAELHAFINQKGYVWSWDMRSERGAQNGQHTGWLKMATVWSNVKTRCDKLGAEVAPMAKALDRITGERSY